MGEAHCHSAAPGDVVIVTLTSRGLWNVQPTNDAEEPDTADVRPCRNSTRVAAKQADERRMHVELPLTRTTLNRLAAVMISHVVPPTADLLKKDA